VRHEPALAPFEVFDHEPASHGLLPGMKLAPAGNVGVAFLFDGLEVRACAVPERHLDGLVPMLVKCFSEVSEVIARWPRQLPPHPYRHSLDKIATHPG
jgi:hypothetical protein